MKNDKEQSQPTSELPDDVADAWAAVLIDVYEKRKHKLGAETSEGAMPDETPASEQDAMAESEEDDDAQSS